jgi:hypothetical protein
MWTAQANKVGDKVMNVSRDKLPKGRSYPVQSSAISAALEEAGVTLDCSVNYLNSSRTGFTAQFWPPNPNIGYERLYLTICCVDSQRAHQIRRFMAESVLPEFITWTLGLIALPVNSPIRREKQEFHKPFPE